MTSKRRATYAVAAIIVIALGLFVRSLPSDQVITDAGIRLLGNDAYYHALRTERSLARLPVVPSFDPLINYPQGAEIPWPPLFDFLAASAAKIAGIEAGTRAFELLLAWIPALLGAISLALLYLFVVRISDRGMALRSTFLLAVFPAHVTFSELGRFDQHVLEVLFLSLAILVTLSWMRDEPCRRPWIRASSLGVLIALSFVNWNGSMLLLGVLGVLVGLAFVMAGRGENESPVPGLAWRSGIIAAAITLGAILLWIPSRSRFSIEMSGVNLFHVICIVMFSGYAWILDYAPSRFRRERLSGRVIWTLPAAGIPVLLALLLPGFKAALGVGLEALTTGGAWLRNIVEYDPLLFTGHLPWLSELGEAVDLFGTGLLLSPIAALGIAICLRRGKMSPSLGCALLLWGLIFLTLTLMSRRFSIYLTVPLSLWLAVLWVMVEEGVVRRITWLPQIAVSGVIAAFLVWPCVGVHLSTASKGPDARIEELITSSRWLAGHESQGSDAAVLAQWQYGHHLAYFARKPVVVTPFGTHLGQSAMEDCASVFQANSAEAVIPILERRDVGYLLLDNPVTEAYYSHFLAPNPGPPSVLAEFDITSGRRVEVLDRFWQLAVSRLYFFDGSSRYGTESSFDRFRLLHESETSQSFNGIESKAFKIFEFVKGARLRVVGDPETLVRVGATLTTKGNRRFEWRHAVRLDANGRGELRLPYATGRNGTVEAGEFIVSSPGFERRLRVSEQAVQDGGELSVEIPPAPSVRLP